MEKLFIQNNHRLKLSAVVHAADTTIKHPAVLILHGFTGYKEETNLVALSHDLEERGIVSFRFDASGSYDSEGTLEHDYRLSNYLSDIESAYGYLTSLPYVDATGIAVCGHSMGGLATIVFASRHPELSCAVSLSPPITMGTADQLAQILPQWKESGWFEKVSSKDQRVIRIPYSFMEDAGKYNALDSVKSVKVPLCVFVGLADEVVSPKNTLAIFEAANEPKFLITLDGVGHGYKKFPEQIQKVNSLVIPWLLKYLEK